MDESYEFGLWEGKCYGCDIYTRVNDLQLCEDCDAKLDRDLIRQRDWAYSASAFGVPPENLEELRNAVIEKHGAQLELIAEKRPKKHRSKKRRKKHKRHRKDKT